jgi:dTDP-glucose pyrophosphorylase
MDNRIKEVLISSKNTILDAVQQMDRVNRKLLIVFNENKYYGLISIGDVQRAIIAKTSLDNPLSVILRDEVKICYKGISGQNIKKQMLQIRAEFMPIIDEIGGLYDVVFWEDIFRGEVRADYPKLNLPVVIMAGGKGTRMRPITNVIPKPLIPLGDRTIIEEIIGRFHKFGCDDYHLSVNYKADLIKHYLENHLENDVDVKYFKEDKPLGTAGSLFMLKNDLKGSFFVINCDILIDDDYSAIYKYHKKNENVITIVAALKSYNISYGVIETSENGRLDSIKEKPELTFQINSGMYILESSILDMIPENKFFHITELIENCRSKGLNVGVFPVSEKSWKDIGEWDQYIENLKVL